MSDTTGPVSTAGTQSDITGATTVQDEKAAAEQQPTPQPKRAPKSKLKAVVYTGVADHRELSVEDISNLGGDAGDPLVWNADNGKRIDVDKVSAKTLDALLALPEFTAV